MHDYENYDYMQAVLKKKYAEKLKECYRAFGWELIVREEDERYDDIYKVKFRRPHKIAHKDELQYMQVELDADFENLSKQGRRFRPKSFFCGLFFCILAAGIIAGGLCLALLVEGLAAVIGGSVLGGIGVATVVCGFILSNKIHRKEIAKAVKISKGLLARISEICAKAAEFSGAEYE